MIFTHSRNAATGDNSMYCMIPDPFPSSAFGKGSATPDYKVCTWTTCIKHNVNLACLGQIIATAVPVCNKACLLE